MTESMKDFLRELDSVPKVKKKYMELQEDAACMAEKNAELHSRVEELERQIRYEPSVSEVERHLNEILDFKDQTADAAGIHLSNIYVTVDSQNGRFRVDLRGEITCASGEAKLNKNACIKASIHDSRGHIGVEGKQYIFRNTFCGYDTFDISWQGGDEYAWLRQEKIRLFVTG